MSINCPVCKCATTLKISGLRDWEYGVPGIFSYFYCSECDINSLNPFPLYSDLPKYYPENYPAYVGDEVSKGWIYKILADVNFFMQSLFLFKKINLKGNILDVGAGSGIFLMRLKKLGANKLYAIDFNSQACSLMEKSGVNVFEGAFLDFNSSEKFSTIVMNNYIEHVLDPVLELKKAFNLLDSKGVLIGTLPNFNGLERRLFGKFWGGNHVPRHTFQFTDKSIVKFLKFSGFTKVIVTHDINPSHIAISIQNYLNRNRFKESYRERLVNGRAPYYNYLLLALIPFNLLLKLIRRSGVISFVAIKE
jgi:2-polyprenyl-3-methyl-5-hydroxy-6-metoxy-1,4-benzoquinol methylase